MLNYRAIARGFLVDLSTTCLFAAALTLALVDPGSSDISMAQRLYGTTAVDWLCLVGGLSLTGLGGFVCGRMVPGREIIHATAVGCLSLLAALWTGAGEYALVDWYTFTGLVLSVPAAQVGGVLAGFYTTTRESS